MPAKKYIDIAEVRRLAASGMSRPQMWTQLGVCRSVLARFLRDNEIKTNGDRRVNHPVRSKNRSPAQAGNPLWRTNFFGG